MKDSALKVLRFGRVRVPIFLLAALMGCTRAHPRLTGSAAQPRRVIPRCGRAGAKGEIARPRDDRIFREAHDRGRSSPARDAGFAAIWWTVVP